MADISKVKLPDNSEYDIKDAAARSGSARDSTKMPLAGGTFTGAVKFAGVDLTLGTGASSSDDSGDLVWSYGNDAEKMRLYAPNTPTAKFAPLFREFKSDGTSLYNGNLVLGDGTGASGTWGISISGNAATATTATKATQDESGNNIKATYSASMDKVDHRLRLMNKNGSVLSTVNITHSEPSARGNMNNVAAYGNSMGMISLSGTDTTINPNGQTGWHHFINMSYTINGQESNMWQTQIANQAGTTDLWVRSRSGSSITDGTAWRAAWTRILTGTNWSNVVTKSAIGLGNVENKSSATIRGEITSANVTTALGYTPVNKAGDTMSGNLTISHATNNVMTSASTNPQIIFNDSDDNQPVKLVYTDYDSYRGPAGLKVLGGTASASPAWFEVEGDIYEAGTKLGSKYLGISANASSATKFSSARTVALTGDTTGSTSADGSSGWSVATTTSKISGTAEAAPALVTAPGTGKIRYSYNVNNGTMGLFASVDNSNSIITLNRHSGNYDSQLGFSSNGRLYYRSFNGVALNNTTAWNKIFFDGDTYGGTLTKSQVTTALGYTPPTTDTNTTYTIGTNGNNITLTPSSGSAQSITAPYATVSRYSDNITITEKESTGGMEVSFPLHVGNAQASSGVTYGILGKEKYTGVAYHFKDGTTSAIGEGALILGNLIPRGTDGNKVGWLRLCGEWAGYAQLGYVGSATSGVTTHYLPNTGGTLINSATYTDYTVTKTGSGASGNWGINISGNAATATTATKLGTSTVGGTTTPIYLNAGVPTALSYTIATSVPANAKFTDENVSVTSSNPTTAENCFIPWVSDLGTQTLKVNNGCRINVLNGTTSEAGLSQLTLGNSTASGTANNKRGNLKLYGRNTGYGQIIYDTTTANTTHTLPSTSGTILNTGTTSFTQTLTSGTKIGTIKINNTSTDIYAPTTSSSSRKIKKNIQAINDEEINKILQLNAVKFDFKESSTNNADHRGFIAEEVAELLPNLTTDEIVDDNGNLVTPMQLNYMEMIPYLVEICKKQQKEIDQLKKIL